VDPRNDPILKDVPEREGYKVLGPCILCETLGRSGMSVVYRGFHVNLDLDVAVKCLSPDLASRSMDAVDRFRREAKIAARIDHPNVVRIYDVSESSGIHYLVMQFVPGENARQRVDRKGPLPLPEALQIITEAARGLAEIHEHGMVHRDIKPDNIMISKAGRVKITDLGLAKSLFFQPGITTGRRMMGTPEYMPLEQWESARDTGPAADVYALGATFYFLLAGKDAVSGNSYLEIIRRLERESFPNIREVREDVPDGVVRIIERATRRHPADRYGTAAEMLADLRARAPGGERDPLDVENIETQYETSPPPQDRIARIRSSLRDAGREGFTTASPGPRIPLKKLLSLTAALGTGGILVATILFSSVGERMRNRVRSTWEAYLSEQPINTAKGEESEFRKISRTDYNLLWAFNRGGADPPFDRTYINPSADQTVGFVHWLGKDSYNLQQVPISEFLPGQEITLSIRWEWVGVRDTPIVCIDVYGDWDPDNHLYHDSYVIPAGGPTPDSLTFSFPAPRQLGTYRLRWMYVPCFDDSYHISSFFGGKADAPQNNYSPAQAWAELLFRVVQPQRTE